LNRYTWLAPRVRVSRIMMPACASCYLHADTGRPSSVTGKGLVDKMECVGGGEKSPLPRSRHGERPVRVIGTPPRHRVDIPVGPNEGSVGNRLDGEGNRGGLRQLPMNP